MSTIDTVHTNRERLEKIGLFIEYCKKLGAEIAICQPLLSFQGETLVNFAEESEACLKILLVQDFIENVKLPEPPKDDKHITIPKVLFDGLQRDRKELRDIRAQDETWGYDG